MLFLISTIYLFPWNLIEMSHLRNVSAFYCNFHRTVDPGSETCLKAHLSEIFETSIIKMRNRELCYFLNLDHFYLYSIKKADRRAVHFSILAFFGIFCPEMVNLVRHVYKFIIIMNKNVKNDVRDTFWPHKNIGHPSNLIKMTLICSWKCNIII